MENFEYYVMIILLLIVGIVIIKKITGCIFRLVVGIIMLGLMAWGASLLGLL